MDSDQQVRPYILAIDHGTTSTKISAVDLKLNILSTERMEHEQITQKPGWTEHDPEKIYDNMLTMINTLQNNCKDCNAQNIGGIGLTNQRQTTVCWNKYSGKLYYNAIVWNDTRTSEILNTLIGKNNNDINFLKKKTGLPLSNFFTALKIKWLIENVPEINSKIKEGDIEDLCFGTIDSYIVYRFTGNFYTDFTNASVTLLMNLQSLTWDEEILQIFGIPKQCLPKILKSSDNFGEVLSGALKGVPLVGVIGDQQASCVGHLLEVGEIKNTCGTGCFIMTNIGKTPVISEKGLLTDVLYAGGDEIIYALEGAIEAAGSAITWLKNGLKLYQSYDELPDLFNSVTDNGGVIFVTSLEGLFSPYWDPTARGTILGLTTHTERGHLIRAVYEGISLRTNEILEVIKEETKLELTTIKLDGGISESKEFLQTHSDILRIQVISKEQTEMTTLGAVITAGLSLKYWKGFSELKGMVSNAKLFKPILCNENADKIKLQWKKAIAKARGWEE